MAWALKYQPRSQLWWRLGSVSQKPLHRPSAIGKSQPHVEANYWALMLWAGGVAARTHGNCGSSNLLKGPTATMPCGVQVLIPGRWYRQLDRQQYCMAARSWGSLILPFRQAVLQSRGLQRLKLVAKTLTPPFSRWMAAAVRSTLLFMHI